MTRVLEPTGFVAAAGFSPSIKLKLEQQITAYNLACHGMGAASSAIFCCDVHRLRPGLRIISLMTHSPHVMSIFTISTAGP